MKPVFLSLSIVSRHARLIDLINIIENVYLETIEHHCKYSDPEAHKSEILRLSSSSSSSSLQEEQQDQQRGVET